ncbi:pyruvate, phosphate dikinase [Vagococcus intermedius]|uniref:Pyruvate, phosphate dikinase n=1 Tax=Vagococcus intermedius TaxID=2991418 RepID=A0AAF0I8X0_9ENTE|nr:pyruvate, phosphate dikinase [Vagococcus intermedius]WEG72932.1 pyruvate, phosphate dikinase [Vagococcus intermedius]WEG75019.1 pyruvate, phosphate dikinase [Vagococcus intermedius]
MTKNVYQFHEGNASMKSLLGGKGANLAEMVKLGLPVPPGFTITTVACMDYLKNDEIFTETLKKEILNALTDLEVQHGQKFNDQENPLLLSVRSGAVFSMPGMMDTILNLGLNDQTVEVLANKTGDARFAYDCYRRLLQMFGNVVYGIDGNRFEQYLDYLKNQKGYQLDTELTAEDLKQVILSYKNIYEEVLQLSFPQDPKEQLFLAIEAVFKSWNNHRANIYRNLHDIPHDLGTAVNIQTMVFGNSGDNSGTGVAFTRNPATGSKEVFGEFLINAQGEDVVAGVRTPEPLIKLHRILPEVYQEFQAIAQLLENHYQDMQDIEFTIESGKLYLLQTRNGKRTARASFQVAHDLAVEGLITKEQALMRLEPAMIDQLLHPVFTVEALNSAELVAKGLPASPGAATGHVVFDTKQAKSRVEQGEPVILVRQETSPEDVEAMSISEAIVTSRGGMTSHAAVVARGLGTCCVAGCSELEVNETTRQIRYEEGVIREGDIISVDGSQGKIFLGQLETEKNEESQVFQEIMTWADDAANLKVRANAETPQEIRTAIEFGAIGIGLARTEHMFFEGPRLREMRRLILAGTRDKRQDPLAILLGMQTSDFEAIFKETLDKPIVIRLLDPPLHEFLPHTKEETETLAKNLELDSDYLTARISELHETNPMLGHRGCRLGVTFPEIYEMQVEAIIRSACHLKTEGITVSPEIMIPLVGVKAELDQLKERLIKRIEAVLAEENEQVSYTIGTMIELPRACLIADQLAEEAAFFSFGTNDLTQMTYGYSRDDAGKFIPYYQKTKVLENDPFQEVDEEGVGQLMALAVKLGRQTKPDLKIGVCGEVGGNPKSIAFFEKIGLNYVSCSPYRVPIARLAVAQSAIKNKD